MKKVIQLIGILVLMTTFSACSNSNKVMKKSTSESLGTYKGLLPCADCSGIITTLSLEKNNQYELKMEYLDAKEETVRIDSGSYKMNKTGDTLTLDKGATYLFDKWQITQLDGNDKIITGPLEDRFILNKINGKLKEIYWKLITLNGEKVEMDSTWNREPYIILKNQNHKLVGNAGCNQLMGYYKKDGDDQIKFEKIASTMMSCPNLKTEDAFKKVLGQTNRFSVVNDVLILFQDKKPLAKFKAVYMH